MPSRTASRNILRVISVLLATSCAAPFLIWSYGGGPPPRRTGAPGERSCLDAGCHSGTRIDDSPDLLLDTGALFTYVPGGPRQRWILRNADTQARAFGFQLTARLVSDPEHSQAGDFAEADSRTQVVCDDQQLRGAAGCSSKSLVQFVQHSDPHMDGQFAFDWTPPATAVGDIAVYVASNASVSGQRNSRIHFRRFLIRLADTSSARVVNAASLQPAISPGSWATIFGTGLATVTRSWRSEELSNGLLPTELDGVSVTVNGHRAALAFVSPNQINFQAPATPRYGELPVRVLRDGQPILETTARTARLAPALFAFDPEDRRYAAAIHANGDFVGKPGLFGAATPSRPCRPGDAVILYGTGFGDTNPRVAPGQDVQDAARLVAPVTFRVGTIEAAVQFSGIVSAGLYQFNIVIPDVPPGDHIVQARTEGIETQASLLLSVAP